MNIDELIAKVMEKAGKATQWTECYEEAGHSQLGYHIGGYEAGQVMLPEGDRGAVERKEDAAYIALMSPANTLRLCDELTRCREALREIADAKDGETWFRLSGIARAALEGGE